MAFAHGRVLGRWWGGGCFVVFVFLRHRLSVNNYAAFAVYCRRCTALLLACCVFLTIGYMRDRGSVAFRCVYIGGSEAAV